MVHELKDAKSLSTFSIRLEMYVNQEDWKKYSLEEKNILNALITSLKESLEKKSLPITKIRSDISKSDDTEKDLNVYLKKIRTVGEFSEKLS